MLLHGMSVLHEGARSNAREFGFVFRGAEVQFGVSCLRAVELLGRRRRLPCEVRKEEPCVRSKFAGRRLYELWDGVPREQRGLAM